jgi:hypothetical protein
MLKDAAVFTALLLASGGAAAYGFEPAQLLLPDVDAQALAIGDVSGDGLDDMVMLPRAGSVQGHSEVLIAVQQADGLLATPVVVEFGTQGASFGSVGLADMDDDGALDIVVGQYSSLAILRNEGALQFSAHAIVEDYGPQTFEFDDIDGDGHLDVVATVGVPLGSFVVYHGDGDGGIREKTALHLPDAGRLQLFDINGDGRRDLAAMGQDEVVISWRKQDGSFANPTFVPLAPHDRGGEIAFSDVNADGRPDFVLSKRVNTFDHPSVTLYLQRADGRFWARGPLQSYDLPSAPRFHDIDGDGDEDLIVPHAGWAAIGLYTAQSKGLQVESLFVGYAGRNASQMAFGDLNGDGRQDIATTSHFGGVSFLAGRDSAIEADLAVYPGLAPNAAAIRLQNHSAHTATGPMYLTLDLDLRTAPFDVVLPAGCERQPWGTHGVRLTCNIDASLAPGAHTTLIVPLLIGPRSGPSYLSMHAWASAGVHDLRPSNNTAFRQMTIWPSPAKRGK